MNTKRKNRIIKFKRVAHYAAIAISLSLSACARVNVGQHVKAQDYGDTPKRIFVVAALDPTFAVDNFGSTVQVQLARCGVASTVYRRDSMQLDAEAKARNAILNFRPDTILNMQLTNRLVNEYGDVLSDTYILTLQDLGQKREVWKASMDLRLGPRLFVDRTSAGEKFAIAIVTQMSQDGILRSCTS